MHSVVNIFGCYFTVFLTSADDALWLLPYLVYPSRKARILHGLLFVGSLQAIVFLSYIISLGGHKLVKKYDYIFSVDGDALKSCLAALAAWVVFVCLLVQNIRRRGSRGNGYEHITDVEKGEGARDDMAYSPKTVFFSSFLNSADELCYFPPLLVSSKVSVAELSLGAFLACLTIIFVLSFCLARCRQWVEYNKKMSTLGVLGVLAISLTIEAVRDVIRS
ncbi:hypothetical protein TrVE_jg13958 [Triparma verrucosa]|uniref:Uncharacterized protein n=1 Tax=Triparma verrucosa TaxID=1606542 RepID=A0A9W7KXI3_9STRA|nr:hypothetical protein TrVE_jg13958 [Triparma verrucosa]